MLEAHEIPNFLYFIHYITWDTNTDKTRFLILLASFSKYIKPNIPACQTKQEPNQAKELAKILMVLEIICDIIFLTIDLGPNYDNRI